jgi:hypothetical protein
MLNAWSLAGCTQRGKIPRGWIFGGEEERGAFGGVARAWNCLFGEAERLNCRGVVYSDTGNVRSVLEKQICRVETRVWTRLQRNQCLKSFARLISRIIPKPHRIVGAS